MRHTATLLKREASHSLPSTTTRSCHNAINDDERNALAAAIPREECARHLEKRAVTEIARRDGLFGRATELVLARDAMAHHQQQDEWTGPRGTTSSGDRRLQQALW